MEHYGEIWGPNAVVAHKSFEPIQKRAVKWILCESYSKYSESDYITRLKQLDLLPIQFYFQLKKLKLFHMVRRGSTVPGIPEYIVQHRSWTAIKSHVYRVEVFYQRCLRRVASIKWFSNTINEIVLQRAGIENVATIIS